MTDCRFTYYREDFGEIPVRVVHMDLVSDTCTRVTSDLHPESRDLRLPGLDPDAKDPEDRDRIPVAGMAG